MIKEKTAVDPRPLFAIKKVTPSYEPQAWQAEGCERCQHCLLMRQQAAAQIKAKSPQESYV
jgi:hypothetical protein